MSMFGAAVNTQASDRGNEPVTRNQFHTFAIQMDARFVAIEARFNELDKRFVELDEKIVSLRSEFVSFKEEMRLGPVKIAGWVAGSMIGSSGVIFGGIQLLRGLL